MFFYRQNANLNKYWSTDVEYSAVSDRTYVSDLGNRIIDTGLTQLEQRVDLKYTRPYWSLTTRFQAFQPLDGVANSYRRVPQLLYTGNFPHPGTRKLKYHLQFEAVQFDHKDDVVKGRRYDIMPGISYNLLDYPGYYLHARANYRYTAYDLDLPGGSTSSPDRALPIYTVDAGLFFDRDVTYGKTKYTHTLEPRIFYLYVKNKDQSNLPVFDTSRLTFDINQLFRTNRFSGADRQSDANQVTLALTSRILRQEDGAQRLKATIGQIYYIWDREVTLPGELTETGKNSDAVAEITWNITRSQKISTSVQWDPEQTDSKVTIFEYNYHPSHQNLLNVAYRFRENSIAQTDLSGVWTISNNWNMLGRWNYSIKDQTTLEAIFGVEYNSCCWAVRLVSRRFIRDTSAEKENSIQLQFVLKGLTKLGDKMGSLLQSTISGYRDTVR